jgi:hypothetical protein
VGPSSVATRSKAWVCGCLLAGIAGSNPTGCLDVCLLYSVFVLSSRGLCLVLITRREESYQVWYVSVCDREASIMRRHWPTRGCCAIKNTGRRDELKHPAPSSADVKN